MSFHRALLVPTLVALAASAVGAQVRQVSLGKAVVRSGAPLSLVTTVRELSGGQVMVADPIERKLMLFDAGLTSFKVMGREGSGPGEYRQPDAVWAFPGDSTLVTDLGNARLSIVGPTGVYGRSIPMASGGSNGPPSVVFPGGTDARGNIYFAPPRANGRLDSTDVMRLDSRGGGARVVTRIKTPDVSREESGDADSREVRIRPIPLSASDGWAVSATGEVAVARSADYHVEWFSTGPVRRGASVTMTRVSVGEAEKREWVNQSMLTGGISMQMEDNNGEQSLSFGRARPAQEPSTTGYKWPATKPPFEAGSLSVDRSGRVWMRRHRAAGQPTQYDVFGADGNLLASVVFPPHRTLVGFGASGLYAVEVDDDGQYLLERYALPL